MSMWEQPFKGLNIETLVGPDDESVWYYCDGNVTFTYVPSEPDHKPAEGGGTPGYAAHAVDIQVRLDQAIGEDDDCNATNPERLKEIESCIEAYYSDEEGNEELVQSVVSENDYI